jgi:hypothetical protein
MAMAIKKDQQGQAQSPKGYTPEAERALLACLLLEPSDYDVILAQFPLTPACFSAEYEAIFEAMQQLHRAGIPADFVAMADTLYAAGWTATDMILLDDLMAQHLTITNVHYYAAKVAKAAYERMAGQAFMVAYQYAAQGDIAGAQERLAERLTEIALLNATVQDPFWDLDVILARPDPVWLLGGILQENTTAILVADSGAGKTWLAWDWSLCIMTGMAWLGRSVKQGHVFYLAGEGIGDVKNRVKGWLDIKHIDYACVRPYLHFDPKVPQLLKDGDVDVLIARMRATLPDDEQPRLIVLDTISTALDGGDINEHKDMSAVLRAANRIKNATGATVLMLTHTNKMGAIIGSIATKADSDCTIIAHRAEDTPNELELRCLKQRGADFFDTFRVGFTKAATDETANRTIRLIHSLETVQPSVPPLRETHHAVKALHAIISHADGAEGVKATQWEQATDLRGGTWDRTKNFLLTHQLVERQPGKFGKFIVTDRGIVWYEEHKNDPIPTNAPNAPERTNSLAGAFNTENAPENAPDTQPLWDEE